MRGSNVSVVCSDIVNLAINGMEHEVYITTVCECLLE